MGVLDALGTVIDNKLDEAPNPQVGTVIGVDKVNTKRCIVELEDGNQLECECQAKPKLNSICVVVFLNNDQNSPFAMVEQDTSSETAKALGYGAFSVGEDGHLYVELPEGQDNPFSVNGNGHLVVDDTKLSNVELYKIEHDHVFRDNTDLGACIGTKGERGNKGANGSTGSQGAGISNITYNDFVLTIVWSNGETEEFYFGG